MKNILFDLTGSQPIRNSKFHGGGDYAEVVFTRVFQTYNQKKIKLFAAYNSSKYINSDLLQNAKSFGVSFIDTAAIKPSEILDHYKIDRFYSPLITQSLGWNLNYCESIITIHGLRQIEMPVNFIKLKYCVTKKEKFIALKNFINYLIFQKKFISKIVSNSNINNLMQANIKIITVSNHSKFSILSFFPQLNEKSITVCASPSFVQLGTQFLKSVEFSKLAELYNISRKKYFLVTNADRWIKNVMRVVQAFELVLDDKKFLDYKIVFTGVTDKKIFLKEIKHCENFLLLGYIERNELETLFENAYSFIYPSLNEGFGYPPMSAMKYGIPVIASGITSIPEICGDAAIYFDPYSIFEIKNRILQLSDNDIYRKYSKKGIERFNIISKKQETDLQRLTNIILE